MKPNKQRRLLAWAPFSSCMNPAVYRKAKVVEYYMILRVQETIGWFMSEEYPNLITARFLQAQQQEKLLRRTL